MPPVNERPTHVRSTHRPANESSEVSRRERAYQHIQSKILNGEFPGGTVIAEVPLSREIGTSRTPVREAIRQLLAEGLIEQIPGRGAIVARAERSDIIELYELREALEVYAVGKVAQSRLHEPYLPVLRRLCDEVRALAEVLRRSGRERLDEAEMERFVAADVGFHMLLLRAANNQRIGKVVGETRVLARIFSYRREAHNARLLDAIFASHTAVLDAVDAGDVSEAMQKIGEHIRASLSERLDTYDRWERQREMNRLMPSRILEELEAMRFGAQLGATGDRPTGADERKRGRHDADEPRTEKVAKRKGGI